MPLDDVVILDIDKGEINSSFNDMEVFPREVVGLYIMYMNEFFHLCHLLLLL